MPEQSNNNDEENNSDDECDLEGVVNNATYQNYLEHARQKYLQNRNLSFAHFHETGHDLVLTRAEID